MKMFVFDADKTRMIGLQKDLHTNLVQIYRANRQLPSHNKQGIQGVSEKSNPPKTLRNIFFTSFESFCMKFYSFVGNS